MPLECSGVFYQPVVRPTRLADIPGFKPTLVYRAVSGGPAGSANSELMITLGYGMAADPVRPERVAWLSDGDTRYCPLLDPSFTATLDDVRLPTPDAGGWRCYSIGGPACVAPTLRLSQLARTPDAQLVLADSSMTSTLALGDLLTERTAMPIGNADWSFRALQEVSLQWSPASDLAVARDASAHFSQPCSACPDGATITSLDARLTRAAGTIDITLPDLAGAGVLDVGTTESVEDRATYYLRATQGYRHDATIAR